MSHSTLTFLLSSFISVTVFVQVVIPMQEQSQSDRDGS